MKEYGGYIELDKYFGQELYPDAIALNSGRNCLSYIIKAKNIKKVYIPYFLCSSVTEACKKSGAEFEYYNIDELLLPKFNKDLKKGEYLYIVSYYGQLSCEQISKYKDKHNNIIVDNAQAFFKGPLRGIDTIYTCRKYFGVPDGAYLYTDARLNKDIDKDISYDRMRFILGRYEKTANEFYNEYVANNKLFCDEPIKHMSELTHNLLRGIDYDRAKKRRTENFSFLNSELKSINKLSLINTEGAFAYPLKIDDGQKVRKMLQSNKIYIPTLWPDVFDICDERSLEYDYAINILPIPVDQRYNAEDMKYIVEEVLKCIS